MSHSKTHTLKFYILFHSATCVHTHTYMYMYTCIISLVACVLLGATTPEEREREIVIGSH